MESYNIVNIQEIETFKKGESYKGEITVFTSDIGPKFLLFGNKSVYLNAFSYMLVLSGRATLLVDSVEYPIDAHSLCILSPLHLTNFRQVSRDFNACASVPVRISSIAYPFSTSNTELPTG